MTHINKFFLNIVFLDKNKNKNYRIALIYYWEN